MINNDNDDLIDDLEENSSLKDDILCWIEMLLTKPEIFASSADSLKEQFMNLLALVAPYAFDISREDATLKVVQYVESVESNSSSNISDVSVMSYILKKCYDENFLLLKPINATFN